jgi:chloride channel 3/4/5
LTQFLGQIFLEIFIVGEACTEWRTWSEFLGVRLAFAQSLLHSFVYVSLAVSATFIPTTPFSVSLKVAFAGSAAVLVKSYAPYAFHTGSEPAHLLIAFDMN